jgi:hypothetical protein
MKFLVYLMTMLFVGSAIAQNPTILQGSYISNVFGNSNFVLNPNAQTNIANVTTVTATVTRSTTTPLVATSEFTVAIGTANGTATWATRAFDAGMKNNNCEARFTYRGFAATSKVHIKQGANTVASLNLTPATDPRIASINFPCGDLSAATTFQVTDTAILAGTNEIGGIYVGLATNMANVAQAEEVGSIFIGSGCNWDRTGAGSNSFGNFTANALCPTPVATGAADTTAGKIPGGKFNNLKPGKYLFMISYPQFKQGSISDWVGTRLGDGSTYGPTYFSYMQQTGELWSTVTSVWQVEYTTVTSPTIQLQGKTENTANTIRIYNDGANAGGIRLTAYRFPSSSELVVTPERQNTWGGVRYYGSALSTVVRSGSAASTTYSTFNNSTWSSNRTLQGKCAAPTSSGNDIGCSIENMPVGSYKIEAKGLMFPILGGTTALTVCSFELYETTTTTSVHNGTMNKESSGGINYETTSIGGVFTNTSLATRNFVMRGAKTADNSAGNLGQCALYYSNAGSDLSAFQIIITPLDQPSNSALYVQGPVLGAQTGAAIPAGYVGEVKRLSSGGAVNVPANNTWFTVGAGLPLPAGVWSCSASMAYNRNGASFTSVGNMIQTFSESSTTGSTYHWERQGIGRSSEVVGASFTANNVGIRPIVFYSNGSQLTWPDGVQRGTNTLYTNGFLGVFTAGTPQYISETECVRLN